MPELRWALIGLGLLFLAGLWLWEWRRSRRGPAPHGRADLPLVNEAVERGRRIEPSLDSSGFSAGHEVLDVPVIHPVEPVRVGVASEPAVDVPAAAKFDGHGSVPDAATALPEGVEIQWPPRDASQVVSLRVVHPRGEALAGRALRNALESTGLIHGPQQIYHRVTAQGVVLVSAASLMRPGSFEPAQMDMQSFRGLNVFCVLPGPLPPLRMLDELLTVARSLAQRLSATVQDQHGIQLDAQRIQSLRQSVAPQDEVPGDGATR